MAGWCGERRWGRPYWTQGKGRNSSWHPAAVRDSERKRIILVKLNMRLQIKF